MGWKMGRGAVAAQGEKARRRRACCRASPGEACPAPQLPPPPFRMCQGDTNSPGAPPIQSLSRPQISLPPLSHCGGAGAATIVARPKSARKLLDAASSIGNALRSSFQNLPIPANLPAPRHAFAADGEMENTNGFQPSVSTPAPSIPNSPAVPTQPALWAAQPPPHSRSPPLDSAAAAAAAAASPSSPPSANEEDGNTDAVPILATPPHVKTPRTPRPPLTETSTAPDSAIQAPADEGSGVTSETLPATETVTAPEPAQKEADREPEVIEPEPVPARPTSRLDQLEQMLNDMTARGGPKRAEFKITTSTAEKAIEKAAEAKAAVAARAGAEPAAAKEADGTEAAGAKAVVVVAGAVGAEAAVAGAAGAVPTGAKAGEAKAAVAEAAAAKVVGEKAAEAEAAAAETAEVADVPSARVAVEAAVGERVDAGARAEAARRAEPSVGHTCQEAATASQSATAVTSEQTRASKDASPAQASGETDVRPTASVATRAEPAGGAIRTTSDPAEAASTARAESVDGVTVAPAEPAGVETQQTQQQPPSPPVLQETAAVSTTTPSKQLRPQSSRLSIDRPITPGPKDFLRLEKSFDSMPKLDSPSEMTRRARSSFNSVASPSGSASTSLKRWQRAISFEAEVAADLEKAAKQEAGALAAQQEPKSGTLSSPQTQTQTQQREREDRPSSPGLCSPAAVLPSPSPAPTVLPSPRAPSSNIVNSASALGVTSATATPSKPDFLDSDEDEDSGATGGGPLFGSALKGSDTPGRTKKPVKQATRKLVFAKGDGLSGSEPAGGQGAAQPETALSPPEPTEGKPRPQSTRRHQQARASMSTVSSLLQPDSTHEAVSGCISIHTLPFHHARERAVGCIGRLQGKLQLTRVARRCTNWCVGAQGIQSRTATGAVEDDEEEEDEFLRDWQKQRAGRQAKLDEARSSTERDSETVAVMEELRRMEAEGNEDAGGSGESPHVNQPFQARLSIATRGRKSANRWRRACHRGTSSGLSWRISNVSSHTLNSRSESVVTTAVCPGCSTHSTHGGTNLELGVVRRQSSVDIPRLQGFC